MSGVDVQIFGVRGNQATRAAQRFFKERRVTLHFVDLMERPMSKGELTRFIQKFGLNDLLDLEGKAYNDAGLAYMRVSDASMIDRIAQEPRLLKLPLVRNGNRLAVGADEAGWKAMLEP
ncbi:MAG TPA: ArsC/Spx/MgsR family protein [Deinococcales bacterium]|nr:ArsC/Spx/MgsR family protein [Deinococcales bacterium]